MLAASKVAGISVYRSIWYNICVIYLLSIIIYWWFCFYALYAQMMNCCITRKKAREDNAHRSQSMEVDDVEETGNITFATCLIAFYTCAVGGGTCKLLWLLQNPRKRNSLSARAKSWRTRRSPQRGRNWRRSTCYGINPREDWQNTLLSGWLLFANRSHKSAKIRVNRVKPKNTDDILILSKEFFFFFRLLQAISRS